MALSVNTNPGAFIALQSLTATNRELAITQNRVSTGLAISGVEDSSSGFIIAQNIRADISGLDALQSSLDNAAGAVDVAIEAGETISDLLIEARGLALAASDNGLAQESRDALQDNFQAILAQINSVVNSAEFNGINVVNTNATNVVSAVISLDGGLAGPPLGTVSPANNILVDGIDLSTGATGLNITNSQFGSAASAQSAITEIDAAIEGATGLNTRLAQLGAAATQIELQAEFFTNLQDTLTVGVGNIVDADLARESAELQALQVQQQLGLTALGIANAAPSALLSLF
ncbi:MAG: flagellin [Rhodothalassiaceae bacterium]